MKRIRNRFNLILAAVGVLFILVLSSCGGDEDANPEPEPEPEGTTITVTPTELKQEMIGFGGALTWYSTWVTGNDDLEAIADLMFTDLGIDIIRFKNWYYPDNYPDNKSVDEMSNVSTNDYAKSHWEATNTLYELAKERNPDIKILFSSWGPPISLKDNNKLQEGTLKKGETGFMYDEFAKYWEDVLDHVPFDPDYISIQNEPTYVNAGWTTCKWGATETTVLPSYPKALNMVYDKIKTREFVPLLLGPESQDIATFVSFSNVLQSNSNCAVLGFHPYNIMSSTPSTTITSALQSVGNFSAKPNIMTEFADRLDWYNSALFIHNSLVHANTSGYIYWKLAWNTPASGEDAGMISINSAASTSGYEVTPFYYLIKHYSKYIDAGYDRVSATSNKSTLFNTAFLSPDNKKLTLVIINTGSLAEEVKLAVTGKTITAASVFQSKTGDYYKAIPLTNPTDKVTLPVKSITTVVLDI